MTFNFRSIRAGQFKTHCLRLLDDVSRRRYALTITKRGKPVAKLVPYDDKPQSLFGCLRDSVTICGDIVQSTGEKWEAGE